MPPVVLLWLVGCGAAAATPASPTSGDEIDEPLFAELPPGALRCGVTRPGRISEQQRSLIRPLVRGHAIGWSPGAPIVATVTAEQEDDFGRLSTVVVARLSESTDLARNWLELAVPVRLDLSELQPEHAVPPSPVRPHAFRVRRLDDRTLRFERGRWRPTNRQGAEADCRDLARRYPSALEVSSTRPAAGLLLPALPRRVDHIIHRRITGVEVERVAYGQSSATLPETRLGTASTILPESTRRFRRGGAEVLLRRYIWDDLVLAREDAVRIARARRDQLAEVRPEAPEEVDVANLARVRQQLRLWNQRIDTLQGARRTAAAESAVALLNRAHEAHPEEVPLVRGMVRLLVDELHRPAEALASLDRALAETPAGTDEITALRLLRREALARSGDVAALALSLSNDLPPVAAGGAEVPSVRAAAEELIRYSRAGHDYERTEGAWLASRRFETYLDTVALRRVSTSRLDPAGWSEALAALVSLRLPNRQPGALSLLVRSPNGDGPPRDTGLGGMAFLSGSSTVRVLQVTTGPQGSAPSLRRLTRSVIGQGPVSVGLFVVPLGHHDHEPVAALIVRGTLSPRGLAVEAADPESARLPWRRIQRFLAAPLGRLDDRVFPPPETLIEADSSIDVGAILDQARTQAVLCEAEQWRVSCRGRADEPGAVRRFLWSLASVAVRSHADRPRD